MSRRHARSEDLVPPPDPIETGDIPPEPDPDATGDTDAPAVDTVEQNREAEIEREKFLRLAAEFDNYRRRATRERAEAGARAQATLVGDLLEALDDLARFAHLDPAATDAATVVQGAEMVERKLMKTLSAAGLEIVNPVNEAFDPERQEAVATEPAADAEQDHTVSRVYQPGYVFKGQLLRPARVVVRQWSG
ncbi:MAG TPA: nucleotide exchange factor GrpE [Gemmatimonadaceae bacterium]